MKIKGPEYFYMQAKFYVTEGKSDEEKIIIEGYASTKDLDRGNDIVVPTAFDSSIKTFMKNNPIMLYQHDMEKAIGSFTKGTIDKKGLFVKGEVRHNIDVNGVGLFEMIKAGTLKTLSIGFRPLKFDFKLNGKIIATEDGMKSGSTMDDLMNTDTIRIIKDLELVEVSIVNVPMNGAATFQVVQKSLKLNKQYMIKSFIPFNEDVEKEQERMLERVEENQPKKEEIEKEEEIIEEEQENTHEDVEKEEEKVEDDKKDEETAEDSQENEDKEEEETETDETSSEKENEAEKDSKKEEKTEDNEEEKEDEKSEEIEEESEKEDEPQDEEKEEDEEKMFSMNEVKEIVKMTIKELEGEGKEDQGETTGTEKSEDDTPTVEKALYDKAIEEKRNLEREVKRLSEPVNKGVVYSKEAKEDSSEQKEFIFKSFHNPKG